MKQHKHDPPMHNTAWSPDATDQTARKVPTPKKLATPPAKKDWIRGAVPKSSKGALHRELGVPQGQKIPKAKITKAAQAGGLLGQRARLAETLSHLRKK